MRYLPTMLAGSALMLASGAIAQTVDEQMDGADAVTPQEEAADPTMADPGSSDPAAEKAFTDAEVSSFAGAMMELQALTGDAATKQQQANEIIAQSGIDTETFNAIGSAMQTDEELARRVRLAAAESQPQPAE
ncbi:DUF4168 domain-containing protein [Qipengyuania flava]|nr:DUF4168 domain-containing protein [Qipengyuania flava]